MVIMMFLSAEWGSTKTGEQEQLIVTALNCVLRVPRYIPQEQRFDVRVLVCFSSSSKKQLLMQCSTYILCVCVYFICVLVSISGAGSTN